MTHPVLPPFNAMPTQRNRRLLLSLPAAVALPSLLTACGGGADLNYDTEQALYFVNEPITPNVARVTSNHPRPKGNVTPTYSVSPALPAGLTLNTQTGLISGTPTQLQRQGTHTVTAYLNRDSIQTQVRITITGRGAWTAAAPIANAREQASSTTLLDGKVLVAGGSTGTGADNTMEIYDPATNTWSSAASLLKPQPNPLNVLLADGRVLALGGSLYGDSYPGTAAVYDPTTNSWRPTDRMQEARFLCTANLLPSGKVLVLGGFGPSEEVTRDTAELWDPGTGDWTVLDTRLSVPRARHTATLLADGKTLLVVGGDAGNTAELYQVDGSATKAIAYGGQGIQSQAVRLDDGSVLVTSDLSNVSRRFNPVTSTWSTSATVSESRDSPTLTVLADGRVLLVGGRNLSASEIYNPDVNRWTAAAPVTAQRYVATAALLGDGSVLFVSGRSRAGLVTTCERYLP